MSEARRNLVTELSPRQAPISRRQFSALALAASSYLASGCGSLGGRDGSSSDAPLGSTASEFDDASSILTERFANVKERVKDPAADGIVVDSVVEGLNSFALAVHQQAIDPSQNTVIGCYSLASALMLTTAGTGGETRSDLLRMLGLEGVDPAQVHSARNALDLILQSRRTEGLVFHSPNRLFVRPGLPLTDAFLDNAVANYGAAVTEANFAEEGDAVADVVNSWAAEQTEGFITEIVKSFDPSTVIALLNAVFLQADWSVDFRATGLGSFTTRSGTSLSVPTFGHDDFLPQHHGQDFVAVEMPYKGRNISMVVIMPENIETFEQRMDLPYLTTILDGLAEEGIHYSLPRWSFEQTLNGLKLLPPLGLPTQDFDFSPMFEGGQAGFHIDKIDQVVRIEVDEEGTTAAAVTDVAIAGSHGPTVTIDKPFFYLIRDRGSKTILFTGTVNDPTQTS